MGSRARSKQAAKAVRANTAGRRRSAGSASARIGPSSDAASIPVDIEVTRLASDLGQMIEAARHQVAQTANAALTTLYWQLGEYVRSKVLEGRRAEYGAQIVAAVGRRLEERHGRGFGEKNLRRMIQFVDAFPDQEIVATLRRQLGSASSSARAASARPSSTSTSTSAVSTSPST